ncbi:uncharacterized protein B4U79_17518 [Dinothrombium tinctorium]|uniref:PDZ domain-containing protein n=1 Tax=Dinothrombium tinctorium TaxID=1965070 RepID=A0A3S3Q0F5_9ACAR|nr:uncharacterized protein B4U79_17518 [Dinothrombium tinctorium]
MASLMYSDSITPKPPSTIRRASSFSKLLNRGSNGFNEFVLHNNDFVTVVKVEENSANNCGNGKEANDMEKEDEDFVTVLEIGDECGEKQEAQMIEEITVYRLPGERLGMALKFEGGGNSCEKVSRVLIQNINSESPASKIEGKLLGRLREGDEILKIDGKLVSALTRLECVAALKEASVCFKLLIKREETNAKRSHNEKSNKANCSETTSCSSLISKCKKGPPPPVPPRMATTTLSSSSSPSPSSFSFGGNENGDADSCEQHSERIAATHKRRPSQPPPLPPRKPKECSSQSVSGERAGNNLKIDACEAKIVNGKQTAVDANREKQQLSGETKSIDDNSGNAMLCEKNEQHLECTPIQAEFYLDSLSEKETTQIESESDDTGSSVSTIIERFSRGSTANSSFSENTNGLKNGVLDIEKVLSPFEQLERELDEKEALQKFVTETAAFIEQQHHQAPSSISYDVNLDDYDDIQNVSMHFEIQNFGEPIVEPPVGFANSVTDNSKAADGWQSAKSRAQQSTTASEKKCDRKPTVECMAVEEAFKANHHAKPNDSLQSKRSREESINSIPSAANGARKSHENQKRVKLSTTTEARECGSRANISSSGGETKNGRCLGSNKLKESKETKSTTALKSILKNKSESRDALATGASRSSEKEKRVINSTTPSNSDSCNPHNNDPCAAEAKRVNKNSNDLVNEIKRGEASVLSNEMQLEDECKAKKSSEATEAIIHCQKTELMECESRNISFPQENRVTLAFAVAAAAAKPKCDDNNTHNYDNEENGSINEELKFNCDQEAANAAENNCDSMNEKQTEEIKSDSFTSGNRSKRISDDCERLDDKLNGNDKTMHNAADKSPTKKSLSLKPLPRGVYSLIPKRLESSKNVPPPVSPRKSKSSLNLVEADACEAKPSLIPRAVIKPVIKPASKVYQEAKVRRTKSSENLKGFGFREIRNKSRSKEVKVKNENKEKEAMTTKANRIETVAIDQTER